MSNRSRVLTFGGAGILVVLGVVLGVVIGGGAGQVVAIVLVGLGLVAAVSLVFYEVGLSEDHARAREVAARRERPRAPGRLGPIRRLDRMRGQQRRLR
jgi:hypothetical protein